MGAGRVDEEQRAGAVRVVADESQALAAELDDHAGSKAPGIKLDAVAAPVTTLKLAQWKLSRSPG